METKLGHLFIHQTNFECMLSPRHYLRCWGSSSEQARQDPCFWGVGQPWVSFRSGDTQVPLRLWCWENWVATVCSPAGTRPCPGLAVSSSRVVRTPFLSRLSGKAGSQLSTLILLPNRRSGPGQGPQIVPASRASRLETSMYVVSSNRGFLFGFVV